MGQGLPGAALQQPEGEAVLANPLNVEYDRQQ